MKVTQGIVFFGAIALALVCGARLSLATIVPYTVDSNTMHLWHLDESTTPAADQAHYTYTSSFTPTKDANQPMNALFGGPTPIPTATLSNAGFTGFGTALNTSPRPNVTNGVYAANSVQPGLGALTPVNGTGDNVDHTFDNPSTHAFTMEALIKIGFNPAQSWSAPQEIISGEGDASDSSDRSWQFRIEANTSSGVNPWVLRFQKVSGFGSPGGSTANFNLDASIPNSGVDAIAQDGWYHVAVTFTGDFATAGNLKLYWTKVDEANFGSGAHLIGTGQMNGWLREQDTDLGFGNELRDFNGNTEPFDGSIDEVRISDIARTPDQFIFGVPEPSSFVLAGLGLVGLVGCLRRRESSLGRL